MTNFHYLAGRWVSGEDLKISVFDLSVVRGFGIFDFLRTYHNKPFRLDDHIDRFFYSAKSLGLKIPQTKEKIEIIVYDGIKKNNFSETNIKLILTGGVSADSITPGKPSFIVMFTKAIACPRVNYENGVKVITIREKRTIPLVKSLNYMSAIMATQRAKNEKAEEAIYVDEGGRIYEATRCNFFAVINKKLVTAKKDILFGITRKVVLELAQQLNIPSFERDLFLNEMPDFEEAFITASNKEVMPVVRIDDRLIGKGKIGVTTKKIMEAFKKLTRGKVA